MAYKIIQPPFTLRFREMSKGELRAYFEWFLSTIPERLHELTKAVNTTKDFETWTPDKSVDSLIKLGEWFTNQVEIRPRTIAEQDEIAAQSIYQIEIPDWDLTNRTFSLAFDIAMYFSAVLCYHYPDLHWEQPLEDKKFADYGEPVLTGFGPLMLNPVGVIVTLAYGIADKQYGSNRLGELYATWSSLVSPRTM